MTKEEFANLITGCEYGAELTKEQSQLARDNGLVVVCGASDDLIEFEGAIVDEGDCWDGGTFLINQNGLLKDREQIDDDDELEEWFEHKKTAKEIIAIWDKDGYSWTYATSIPHATFEVVEDGDKYCRGIVFALADL